MTRIDNSLLQPHSWSLGSNGCPSKRDGGDGDAQNGWKARHRHLRVLEGLWLGPLDRPGFSTDWQGDPDEEVDDRQPSPSRGRVPCAKHPSDRKHGAFVTTDSQMRDLAEPLKQLSDAKLDQAERATSPRLNFTPAINQVRVIRRLARAFALEYEDELPSNVPDLARQSLNEVSKLVGQMVDFDPEGENAYGVQQSLLNQTHSLFTRWVVELRPHIRGRVDTTESVARAARMADEADTLLRKTREAVEESGKLLETATTLGAEMAAGNLSRYYDEQAARHTKLASKFLLAGAVWAAGLASGAVPLLLSIEARSSDHWTGYLRDLSVRVFVVGLGLYVLGFLAKSYRANQHLRVVNEHKGNALKTFRLFQESVSGDSAARDLITAELVKAVFAADETGFLDNTPDRTVVEGQAGLIAMLANQRA